jgi:hypothetical protein
MTAKLKNLKTQVTMKSYTDDELRKLLIPKQVEQEFGIKKSTLETMRTESKETGKLRGPMFLQDGKVIFYQRKAILLYLKSIKFVEAE